MTDTARLNLRHLSHGYRSFYRQLHTMRDPLDYFTDTPSRIDDTERVSPERAEKQRDEATYPPMKIEDIDADTAHAIIRAQQDLPK